MDGELFQLEEKQAENDVPVTCLGITFNNDNERREFFRNELRKKLPELKLIEGFPIGAHPLLCSVSSLIAIELDVVARGCP